MEARLEIDIDIDDVFSALTQNNKETFINDNINQADDDVVVEEIVKRDLFDNVIERLSLSDLITLIKYNFDVEEVLAELN